MSEFVHLHLHSECSLLDGSIKVKKLISELAKRGDTACALTDHDAMHGAAEFHLGCKDKKINGIVGYEANLPFWTPGARKAQTAHLLLLAENSDGYKNLLKLCTLANTEGTHLMGSESYALKWEWLAEHAKGLICLTSCLMGELQTLLLEQNPAAAKSHLQKLKGIFGKDQTFVELIDNGIPSQRELIPALTALAAEEELETVATADVHYIKKEDIDKHLSLLAIKHKLRREEVRDFDKKQTFHMRSAQEMYELFPDHPKALRNTLEIASRCQIHIETKTFFMPGYTQREGESPDECLVRLSWEGLEKRKTDVQHWMGADFNETIWNGYKERLEYELGVILKMNFAGYFLIVQDFINWAKDKGIPVGPGRGSAAGSLVTYCLRITNIDPIRFILLFERFLNPERVSMPDIDTDFCQDRRGEVLDYVYKKYKPRAVAQIVTFGSMKAKATIKNFARIQGWSFHDANNFAKLIPEKPGVTLLQALNGDEGLELERNQELEQRLKDDERARELWDDALELEGTLSSLGVHAAGVIISDRSLDELCPLMEVEGEALDDEEGGTKQKSAEKRKFFVTQFEQKYSEKIGLVKFDFLGLKNLTAIEKTVEHIRKFKDPSFDIERISLDDPKVYEELSTGHTTGIFQVESGGMRKLIAQLKPNNFTDIVSILSLYRPGPIKAGVVDDFVERKHGRSTIEYAFPELEPILKDTYGVMVFQEQVLKIAQVLAGYSLGEADLLRRAMGKKDKVEMEKQKNRFLEGSTKNGFDAQKISDLFDMIAKFAEYAFNKSHTAAYGYITYQTAFLKTHFPTEFLAASMSCDLGSTEKIVNYVRESKRMGVQILPPNINASDYEFTFPKDRVIRFGLGAIKGLGQDITEALVAERVENGLFYSFPEFIARMVKKHGTQKINKKVMESLIKSGCFDTISSNRNELWENCDLWLRAIARECENAHTGGGLFDFAAPTKISQAPTDQKKRPDVESWPHENGYKPLAKPTLLDVSGDYSTLLGGILLQTKPPWDLEALLECEKAALGFWVTGHPADIWARDIQKYSDISIKDAPSKVEAPTVERFKRSTHTLAGVLTDVFEKTTKEGKKFAVYKIEDGTGELEATLFAKQYEALHHRFAPGEAVWMKVQLQAGMELNSVRATISEIGLLEDKRIETCKKLSITFQEKDGALAMKHLTPLFAKYKSQDTRIELFIRNPDRNIKAHIMLGFGVKLSNACLKDLMGVMPDALSVTWDTSRKGGG